MFKRNNEVKRHFKEIADELFRRGSFWLALEAYDNSNVSRKELLEIVADFLKVAETLRKEADKVREVWKNLPKLKNAEYASLTHRESCKLAIAYTKTAQKK